MKAQDEDKDMKTFHAVDTDGEYQEKVDQTQVTNSTRSGDKN